jgi:hypothetical protein
MIRISAATWSEGRLETSALLLPTQWSEERNATADTVGQAYRMIWIFMGILSSFHILSVV